MAANKTRFTKIIATIGPASCSKTTLTELVKAGVDTFRFNLSHSTRLEHRKNLKTLREVCTSLKKDVGILFDLAGPKLRIGKMKEPTLLKRGQDFTLTNRSITGSAFEVSVNQNYLISELKKNDIIFLDEGRIELRVKAKTKSKLVCQVKQGGLLNSNKGINVTASLSTKPLTKKDYEDIGFAMSENIDWLALSFVRQKKDIKTLKTYLKKQKANISVMAKIEKKEAVENIDEIIAEADGIMVARGDLGVELPLEDVPLIQKQVIGKCMQQGKAVVTATQMLESMVNNRQPTRAEVNDVANAIFDQTDAVMLSAESAVGKYPVEAVRTMAKVIKKTESAIDYGQLLASKAAWVSGDITDAISFASCEIIHDLSASLLVTSTQTGSTAIRAASYRCPAPILAITPEKQVQTKLKLIWGVIPLQVKPSKNINDMLDKAKEAANDSSLVRKNDRIVITAGALVNVAGTTNLIKVEVIE